VVIVNESNVNTTTEVTNSSITNSTTTTTPRSANATTKAPATTNATTKAPTPINATTMTPTTTTRKPRTTTRKGHRPTKPPIPVFERNNTPEPRAQDNRPLRQQLDEVCFIEEDEHDYLYECSEEQMCICLHTSFIVTVPINTGKEIMCLIEENFPCVSPHRPNKPYRCHPRFFCDVNGSKLCKPCKNETYPDGCLKKRTDFSSRSSRNMNVLLLSWANVLLVMVVSFL